MKNIDKLRQMSAKELAQALVFDEDGDEIAHCKLCAYTDDCNDKCYEGVLKWLGMEANA